MAITARDGDVPTGQFESRLLVLCQSEGRGSIPLQVVALITLVLVRFSCELIVVFVHMAISAAFKVRDPEDRIFPLGNMAFVTCHFGVTVN